MQNSNMIISIFMFYYQKKGIPSENPFLFRKEFFLAHLSHWLMVSYCDRCMYVVRRQQLLQTTSPPKLLAGFGPNLVGMILF